MTSETPDTVLVATALDRDTLLAKGPDAVAWLDGLLTCDLRELRPGVGAFGLLLTKTGKIQTDVDVVARPGELVLGLAPGAGERVRAVLDAHLVMEDVELSPAPRLAWLKLVGPGSAELAQSFSSQAVGAGAIGWFGTEGAALVVARDALPAVTSELLARAGQRAREVSNEGWDALRLLHALPAFGKDYDSDDNPHEAALDRRAVSWDKGCYLGQEVVCMQDMRGRVKRRLAVLRVQGNQVPSEGAVVLAADSSDPVGAVRTAARTADGAALVFAALRAPYFDAPGRGLSVEGRPAEIVAFRAP